METSLKTGFAVPKIWVAQNLRGGGGAAPFVPPGPGGYSRHSSPICVSTFTNVLALHFEDRFD